MSDAVSTRPAASQSPAFRTSDTQLTAYLMTIGRPLVRVEGPSGRRVFVLNGVTDADRMGYYGDTQLVSARRLFGTYRDLKNAMFETP